MLEERGSSRAFRENTILYQPFSISKWNQKNTNVHLEPPLLNEKKHAENVKMQAGDDAILITWNETKHHLQSENWKGMRSQSSGIELLNFLS